MHLDGGKEITDVPFLRSFRVLQGPSTDGTPDILADIMLPMLLEMGVERKVSLSDRWLQR